MRKQSIFFSFVIVYIFTPTLYASIIYQLGDIHTLDDPPNINFYDDGIIQSGNYYDVNVYNSSNVIMSGGSAFHLYLYNSSSFTMNGGTFSSWAHTHNNSTLNIYGGKFESVSLADKSTINIHGGEIVDYLTIFGTGKIHFYGYDFIYQRSGGGAESGWLSGIWADGSSFSVYLRALPEPFPGSQIILYEIPEPASLSLLALGLFVLHSSKSNKHII